MNGLCQTHGVTFELVRHFLLRMFDSEMFSVRGQWRPVAVSAAALAVPAGILLLDPPYLPRAIGAAPEVLRAVALADQLGVLTLVGAVTGILALLGWQSLLPGRRDLLALAGLPVRPRQIFAARFAAVSSFGAGLVALMALSTCLIAPHQFTADTSAGLPLPKLVLARAASSGLECIFVFFCVVALQGLLVNLLSPRLFAKLSAYVQGFLLCGCFLAALCSWYVVDWSPGSTARLFSYGVWAPPAWFAALHQVMTAGRDPFFEQLARQGLAAAAAAVLLSALMYLLAYLRYRRAMIECPEPAVRRGAESWGLERLLARDPRQQAILRFLVHVFSRSRAHRLVVVAYVGAGIAILVNSVLLGNAVMKWREWREVVAFSVLYWPVGLSFAIIAGVRHAFLLPAEWKANWLFQITESQGRREWMAAVERFLVFCVIAPIHLAVLPPAVTVLGWQLALRMTALQALVSLAAFDFLFAGWQQLPFACSYVPGKRPLVASIARWISVYVIVVPILTRIIAAMSQMWELFLVFLGAFAGVRLWARSLRRETWGEGKLIYEDPGDAVADLGLRELTNRPAEWPRSAPATSASVPPPGRPVAISLRLYKKLARAFPHEFRSAYGDEMLQLTEDTVELIWDLNGVPGLVRLLSDIAFRVAVEHLAGVWRDVRYGLRALAASPGFTAVAAVSLSLGICIGTSAFSMMRATILRDLPAVLRPDELVALQSPASFSAFRRYQRRGDLFSFSTAYTAAPLSVRLGGRSQRIWGHLSTSTYFATLGVQPALGRLFDEEQERSGAVPVAVVSYRFWQTRLGADPSVLGTELRVNGRPCTLVGVAPRDFLGASPIKYAADIWIPVAAAGDLAPELAGRALEKPDRAIFQVVGRLWPGVPETRAEAALDAMARQVEQEDGSPDKDRQGRRVTLVKGGRLLPVRSGSLPMMVSSPLVLVGLMLLIACSNVANMMLARAAGRRREIAVRLALGAGRARLVRQLLTESLLLALGAGVLGFLLAVWLMGLLSRTNFLRFAVGAPYPMPVISSLQPDGAALLLSLGLAVFAGLSFGLLPALRATRADLSPALKEGGNIRFRRFRRLSLRNVLVLSQMAASLTLLLLTGMLATGYQKLLGLDLGFDPQGFSLVSLDPVRDGYPAGEALDLMHKLLDRVRRLPSVASVALTDTVPVVTPPSAAMVVVEGDSPASSPLTLSADRFVVGQDYFDTLGVPILLGRGFRREDESNGGTAVLVSERMAREAWKTSSPLGRRIEIAGQRLEVVGVARNVKVNLSTGPARPAVYLPLRPDGLAQPSFTGVTLIVRAVPGADALGAVLREISVTGTDLTPFNAVSMPEEAGRLTYVFQVAVWIHWFEGVFGLILASVGLAGVTAYSVVQRRREIGIRIALGARRADVFRLVMTEGVVLVALGSLLGLAGGWAGRRVLGGVLSELARVSGSGAAGPLLLVGAPLLLAGLALASCYVPARKALHVDPVVALRQE